MSNDYGCHSKPYQSGMHGSQYGNNEMNYVQHGNQSMMHGQYTDPGMMYGNWSDYDVMPGQYGDLSQKTNDQHHKKQMHDHCTHYKLHFMHAQLMDGSMVEGIIDEHDEDGVTLMIPCGDDLREFPGERVKGFGYGPGYGGGYWNGGYGHGHYGQGRYPRRFRRYRRHRYPFSNIFRFFEPFFF